MKSLLSLVVLCGLLLPLSADEAKGLKAGAFAMDVTPLKYPISVNGGMADRQATAAHDPLHARCLVLDDGVAKLAIVVVDSCMIPREIMDSAKEQAKKLTGIPPESIIISATHTHTAPTVGNVFQSLADADYSKFLAEKIAKGIEKAHALRVPAKVGFGLARDETQLFNRRWKMKEGSIAPDPFGRTTDTVKMNPGHQVPGLLEQAGTTDPEISLLSVQTREGKPLALVANYSLHYVGGYPELSADYFAAFADRITQLIDPEKKVPDFVAMMSNGTSGDVNNVNFAGPPKIGQKPGEQIRIVADSVAKAAFAVYPKIAYRENLKLASAEKEIELGVRKPDAADLKYAQEVLEKAKAKKVLTTLPEIYANETVNLVKYPDTVRAKIQFHRIGDIGIATIPCEVFTEIGLTIKKTSPLKKTFTISLANGYNGYLPTPEQHKLGGYETWRARSSYLEVDASTKILKTFTDLYQLVGKD